MTIIWCDQTFGALGDKTVDRLQRRPTQHTRNDGEARQPRVVAEGLTEMSLRVIHNSRQWSLGSP